MIRKLSLLVTFRTPSSLLVNAVPDQYLGSIFFKMICVQSDTVTALGAEDSLAARFFFATHLKVNFPDSLGFGSGA